MPLTAYQKADPVHRELWQDLMDKDDRNSPAEYPGVPARSIRGKRINRTTDKIVA